MKIRPNERQEITDMIRDELETAHGRILDRFSRFERQTANTEDATETNKRLPHSPIRTKTRSSG